MAIIEKLRRLLALIAFLGLAACPPPRAAHLWNNTGADVSVELTDRTLVWKKGTVLGVGDHQIDGIEWSELAWREIEGGGKCPSLRIVLQDGRARYDFCVGFLTEDYFENQGGLILAKLQLENDGRFFALKADQKLPVEQFPPQPKGFPLTPETL